MLSMCCPGAGLVQFVECNDNGRQSRSGVKKGCAPSGGIDDVDDDVGDRRDESRGVVLLSVGGNE